MSLLATASLAGFALSAQAQQFNSGIAKFRFGSAYDNSANPMRLYGTSYIGFNLEPRLTGSNWEWIADTDGGNNGAGMIYGDVLGSLNFVNVPTQGGTATAPGTQLITSANLMANNISMSILRDGRVRIGRTEPDRALHGDYKLAVAGKIVSQSLFVTRPNTWSDFVFAPAYRLRTLPEVADYIGCHQHLPDVPSAAQVLADGYDVNEMNARLLQKVEELTLYVLQLNT